MQQLQEAQLEHMNKMVEAFTAASIPASQEARNLHERRFREPRGLGEVGRDRARGDHGRRGRVDARRGRRNRDHDHGLPGTSYLCGLW